MTNTRELSYLGEVFNHGCEYVYTVQRMTAAITASIQLHGRSGVDLICMCVAICSSQGVHAPVFGFRGSLAMLSERGSAASQTRPLCLRSLRPPLPPIVRSQPDRVRAMEAWVPGRVPHPWLGWKAMMPPDHTPHTSWFRGRDLR
jgi:hypothetical protein